MVILQSHVKRAVPISCTPPEPVLTEFVEATEAVNIDGRVINRPIVKEVLIADKFKGLSVEDFTLENLAAAGALDNMSEVRLVGLDGKSVDMAISRSDSLFESISSKLNSSENVNA